MANLGLLNKNAGNLRDPSSGNFRKFNTPEAGRQALIKDIQIKQSGQSSHIQPGASIAQLGDVWAPPSDRNVPGEWANNVSRALGVPTAYAFDKVPAENLANAIQVAEGTNKMPTQTAQTGTLVQKIRAKYPQYNDIPDAELEKKVLTKYPQYQDLASPQNTQTTPQVNQVQPEQGGAIGKFVANQFLGVGPVNQNEGFGASLVSNTIGNKGLAGVAQLPGRVAAAKISSNVAEDIANSASSLQDMSNKLSEAYMKETNPQQKEQLRKAILDAQTQINKGFSRANTEGDLQANQITSEQALGTGLNAATTVAPFGMTGKVGLAGKLAQGVALGASGGAGQAMAGNQNAGDVAKSTAIGGATGGVLAGAGALIEKAAKVLPEWFVKRFIPTKSDDIVEYAATKRLGSPKMMLQDSESSISKLGDELGSMIKNPKGVYAQPTSQTILENVAAQFPNSGLTAQEIAQNLEKIAPLQKKLITKFVSGADLILTELHDLNSAIGKTTFKSVFDEPALKAGKEIGSAVYHEIGNAIKTAVPESSPIFDQLSKEFGLRKALEKAVTKGGKFSMGLPELLAFISGGPLAAGGIAAIRNPTINLTAMQALKNATLGKIPGLVGKSAIAPISRGLINSTRP